jgi:hypothetical protein
LRYRLESAAKEHAALVRAGWRIEHTEVKQQATIDVDGQPFTLTGTIDRIDRHVDGRHRIIDYKTSDSAKKPERTHRSKAAADDELSRGWVDLQLPLYVDLAGALGVSSQAELGYFNLPKKQGETGWSGADWDAAALAEARAVRDQVVRRLRAGVFWPPTLEPPRFDDGLAGLTADHAAGRSAIIAASAARAVQIAKGAGDGK